VLMAAAVILIPEMLSGPERVPEQAPRALNDGPMKTYTIDLDKPPGENVATAVNEEPAPPQEPVDSRTLVPPPDAAVNERTVAVNGAEARADSIGAAADRSAPAQSSTPAAAQEPATAPHSAPASRASEPARQAPAPQRPLASEPTIPNTRGWAVQLGSFSSRASAERLAQEFRADRSDVFVMPVKTGSATLFRVRIGPIKDRATAEDALRKAKQKVAGAAIVAHP
jgi:DedD protein